MLQELVEEYIKSLNDKEKKAYEIAVKDLGSSFDVTKAIGFLKFKKEKINK
tara:strand:+ start:1225 stop:1377 length:153 start_codon:yes stop_codon:yes gene_type:complete